MKKICFLIMILFSFNTVNASVHTTQKFEDVYITYETPENEKVTVPVNFIKNASNMKFAYKLYFGEVTTKNYDILEDDFLKISMEMSLNNIAYHIDEINVDNDNKWFYVGQLKIYEKIYKDYNIYFSDKDGNKNNYLDSEITEFEALLQKKVYDVEELTIHNNELLEFNCDNMSKSSNLITTHDGEYNRYEFESGTKGHIELSHTFNKDGQTIIYKNPDNFVLFEGGGEFYEHQKIDLFLANSDQTVDTDNPATGNVAPYVPIVIGIPVIILGAIVYKTVRKIKN